MNILIVPDSYKGSLSSAEVCECIANGIAATDGSHTLTALPFADGGEGFMECLVDIRKGNMLYTQASDIYGKRSEKCIGVFGDTAVIDCATASGIQAKKNVIRASSYGTGELIKFAVSEGFCNIILGLGGTGCCDGGAGALAALGVVFYDENQIKISRPNGGNLNDIFGINLRNRVKDINFTFACDVDNVYAGKNGAAYVFAPQKGATPSQVELLDEGLKRLNAFLPGDVSSVAGAGAAGGICGGLYSVYGGVIRSGFDILAEYADLENKIADCDLVITGEGKTDRQTLMGKLPYKVTNLARQHSKPCIVISGTAEDGVKLGDKMFTLTDEHTDTAAAIAGAATLLTEKSKIILQNIADII